MFSVKLSMLIKLIDWCFGVGMDISLGGLRRSDE